MQQHSENVCLPYSCRWRQVWPPSSPFSQFDFALDFGPSSSRLGLRPPPTRPLDCVLINYISLHNFAFIYLSVCSPTRLFICTGKGGGGGRVRKRVQAESVSTNSGSKLVGKEDEEPGLMEGEEKIERKGRRRWRRE